jgi:CheY-like chemotaxis protein
LEHSSLAGYSILLVEPNPLLASDLGRALYGAGAQIFIALTAIDALRFAESSEISGAVLNYALSIKDGHQVAARLRELGIPFAFCKDIGRNEAWPHVPVLNEPFRAAELIELLRSVLDPVTEIAAQRSQRASSPPRATSKLKSDHSHEL